MLVRNYTKFAPLAIAGLVLSSFSNVATAVNIAQTPALSKLQLVSNHIPKPELVFKGQEAYTNAGKNFQRYNLAVANSAAFPSQLFESSPDLPPCGLNKNSSRTWVDIYNAQNSQRVYGFCAFSSPQNLNSLWFAVEQGQTPPSSVYIVLTDRRTKKTYRSNSVSLQTQALKEDCIAFNPNNITVNQVNGSWKIIEGGNHWMFDFGNKASEAKQAFQVIKNYRMNKSCFVGRPQPSFTYLLVNNAAPSAAMPGEDCVAFNPATTTVKKINNRWKVVDGNHWMFDFDNNQAEAEQSLAIIKKYQFTRSCYVGRPNPSFSYLRK
ncbi:hypothetical protein WDZ92_08510 [Nostoc sp. NIES-2111]